MRRSCSAGIAEAYRPIIARAARFAAAPSGPVANTIQAPMSSRRQSRPARSVPSRTFATRWS
nr:hypothetical protein [Saccharopolyspora sp. 6V]